MIDLAALLPPDARLVAPLTLGNHVDHLVTRFAAEQLRRPIRYYLDFPYAAEHGKEIPKMLPPGFQQTVYPILGKSWSCGKIVWQRIPLNFQAFGAVMSRCAPLSRNIERCTGVLLLWSLDGNLTFSTPHLLL